MIEKSIDFLDLKRQHFLDLSGKEYQYHSCMELSDVIANWIRSSRQSAGLTQPQLGEAIGLTKANISAWETKRHEPSVAQLVRIGQICRTPLPQELGVENNLSPEALRFALAYQALPQELRKQLLDTMTTAEIAAKSLVRR